MAKNRYYVVWNGVELGIYDSWDKCRAQIEGVKQALYKGFATLPEAQRAYSSSPSQYIGGGAKAEKPQAGELPANIYRNALAVDAACSGNPGQMEYRGVCLRTGVQLFHFGPVYGTNNIGEFLAIVHALALLQQAGNNCAIYSDSRNAMKWVATKQCRTTLPVNAKTQQLHALIQRAENWLRTHTYANPILKWDTPRWGEIPADFGRKG